MKEMDCIEVLKERKKYTNEGVYKGMQGSMSVSKPNTKERSNSPFRVPIARLAAAQAAIKESK